MKLIYSTGGREKYFKKENVGDCVVRAICNATGLDYKEVYDNIPENLQSSERAENSEYAIEELDSAISNIEYALEYTNETLNNLEESINN